MGDRSAIEWTDATWNPVTGCTKVSRGCENCYAERFAERFRGVSGHPFESGFDLKLHHDRLRQPLVWKRPRRIFVNSMSDLFHKEIDSDFIDRVFDTMEAADHHVFQILTKRSSLMKTYLIGRYANGLAPQHIWCGVSVEDRKSASRIRHLQDAPASVRFLSVEPLLGPVGELDLEGISWVIVGGESGPKARPMEQQWVLDIRDQCRRGCVDFFFKQWGGPTPKSRGRRLEGVEYNAMPDHRSTSKENIMNFRWYPNEPPPQIEPASKAKLSVFREYLRAYFDRLNANPSRDEFRLDLVDGFSGGGVFSDGNEVVVGTPLIMLEETESAKRRLNAGRNKPLRFDCMYHFVDKERSHTDYLQKVLDERDHQVSGGNIKIYNESFEDVAGRIIKDVSRRQPRAGRAIFLLDQTGYAQVDFYLIARIFRELPASEVILTFAADTLINFLSERPAFIKSLSPLRLSDSQIQDLIRLRDGDGGRALIQRVLRDHTRSLTGAQFDTPFFIRPEQSRRALWFFHLSQHPTARDVMIQRHWEIYNTFEHYGSGDFDMLGWDTLRDFETLPLFRFGDTEAKKLHDQLLSSLPREIFRLASDEPISVGAFQQAVANRTAARFSDLNRIVIELAREGEIEILTRDRKRRSRALRRVGSSDLICFPETLIFPGWSRFGDLRE